MKALIKIVFGLVAFLLGSSALAQKDVDEDLPPCTVERAKPVTIEAIQNDFDSWFGECVAVRGIFDQRRFYADRKAFLELPDEDKTDKARSIPINLRKAPVRFGQQIGRPVEATLIAMVYSCQHSYDLLRKEQERNSNVIIMMGGFCHYTLERYLLPIELRDVSNAPVERLLKSDLEGDEADLIVTTDRFVDLAAHQEAADKAFAALSANDIDAYLSIALEDYDAQKRDDERDRWEREDTADAIAEFGQVKGVFLSAWRDAGMAEDTFEQASFVSKVDLDFEDLGMRSPARYFHCRCPDEGCEERFPVMSVDATNAHDRPFVCVETNSDGSEANDAVEARFRYSSTHFAEPLSDE
ncbi:hypothetical protein [Erythrobacter sp. F6033]|uniref:hypothetical protein n=1 Tax=Erythrobacter sp. F6033 TaxID=2926401 RepID=UPI001FF28BE7|nr:hypothetical protein [Erythrobacter sp. F6033]MCK0127953.1 hypothetical protein [Erythrobacter sp. F6033]